MITINAKYCASANAVADQLERCGFTVAVIYEVDVGFEDDQRRAHRQNLSPHDWQTVSENAALHSVLYHFKSHEIFTGHGGQVQHSWK